MDRDDRVMVFIDGSNLYHSLKAFFKRTDLDIGKFCQKLIEKKRLIRNYYYNAVVGVKQEPERLSPPAGIFLQCAGGAVHRITFGAFGL